MKKNIFYLIILGVFAATSCSKNIELNPLTAIDASVGYPTKSDLDAALNGCYSSMLSANYLGIRYYALCDLAGDNLTWTGTFVDFSEVNQHLVSTNNASTTNMWVNVYSGINRINNVIYSIAKNTDPAVVANKATYQGEAQTLRGFQYFNLLRFFGGSLTSSAYNQAGGLGVPLITNPTLAIADTTSVPRSTEADCWKLVISDLKAGVDNLPAKNGTGHVNKYAAEALLARAYLYTGDWANAEAAATDVITKGGYTLVTGANYGTIFSAKNSSESIFELQFDSQNQNSTAFFFFKSASGGRNEINTNTSIANAHEAGDLRKPVNIAASPVGSTLKYTSTAGLDNIIVTRLAELYLIRAEARAKQSNLAGSLADINIIRTRAGLPLSIAATAADLMAAIEQENRIEFAFEGHRWFDIRRYNKTAAVGVTQGFRVLWPIPQREVDNSGGVIAQTPGY